MPERNTQAKKQLTFSLSTFYATKKEKGRKNFQTFSKTFSSGKKKKKEKKSKRKALAKTLLTIYVLGLEKGRKILKKFIDFLT